MAVGASSFSGQFRSLPARLEDQRIGLLLLIAITALAAALRFVTLGHQSFDFDESFTAGVVLKGSLGHLLRTIPKTESTPPLYYLLAWGWSRAFGLGEVGLRSLSALLGTALVPVVWVTGRRLGSPRAGAAAALLVAANPLMVWYSQEARSYVVLALLSAGSFLSFTWAREKPTPRRLAGWALLSAGALLSHYFAVFLIAPEAIALLRGRIPRRAADRWAPADEASGEAGRPWKAALAVGAVAAVGAALVPLLISQADNRTQWIEGLSLSSRVREVGKKWLTGEISPVSSAAVALVALLTAGALAWCWRRLEEHERPGALITVACGVAALVLPFVLDVAGLHYLISKNVMPALTILLIAVALVLGCRGAGAIGVGGLALLVGFFLVMALAATGDPALQRPDYRGVARVLGPPRPGQVVVTPPLGDFPLMLYRPGAIPAPPAGYLTKQVVLVEPVPRRDAARRRVLSPPPPPGFIAGGTLRRAAFTLFCFRARAPRGLSRAELLALSPSAGSQAQVWPTAPHARAATAPGGPC